MPTPSFHQPLVTLSTSGFDLFETALDSHGFPYTRIETDAGAIVAIMVITPPGIWVIDVTAAFTPGLRQTLPEILAAVRQETSGAVPIHTARLRESAEIEQSEPDGTLRANQAQLTARFFSPGPISQQDAIAAIKFLQRRLATNPNLTAPQLAPTTSTSKWRRIRRQA